MLERERTQLNFEVASGESEEDAALTTLDGQEGEGSVAAAGSKLVAGEKLSHDAIQASKSNDHDEVTRIWGSKKAGDVNTNDRSDVLGKILAKAQKPPSVVLGALVLLAASLPGLVALSFGADKSSGWLYATLALVYFLHANLKFHAAAALEEDGPHVSPTHLLIAVSTICILSLNTLVLGKEPVSVVFALMFCAAVALASAVQCWYLKQFMKVFAAGTARGIQKFICAMLFTTNFLACFKEPQLLFLAQYALVCLQAHWIRCWAQRTSAEDAAAKKGHISQILLPYQSSQVSKMLSSRLTALRNSPALLAAGLACCVGLWLSVNWMFSHYVSQSPDPNIAVQGVIAPPDTQVIASGANFFNSSQTILTGLIILCALAISYLARASVSRPDFILFSPAGVRLIFTRFWTRQSELLRWDSLTGIHVENATKSRSSDQWINFANPDGNDMRLQLSCIGNSVDRKLMLNSIKNWGRLVPRDAAVEDILEVPSDHSYTELWLQSLTAPPKRERLKPLIAGAVLQEGAFEVIRSLGSGGQGFAYLVWDTINHQEAVLKEFILPTFVSSVVRMRALEAFENEARILKSLDHEQIVRLRDFFVEDHRAYLVLDYLKGTTLKDYVRLRGKLDESSALLLAEKMCEILVYLHGLLPPVIHRDFTPDNLIYDENGRLTLIDFNVAQEEQESTTGNVVGKHAYVPPEQFQGQARTVSDIYALGATLYYLLVGVDPQPITTSIISDALPSISPDIDHLVRKATALDAAERYPTATALLDEIKSLLAVRNIDPEATFFTRGDKAQTVHSAETDLTSPAMKEPTRDQPGEETRTPNVGGIKDVHNPRKSHSNLALASCALVLLLGLSLSWIHIWPFQEFISPGFKRIHASTEVREKVSIVYEAWDKLRFKLADELATQYINEFSNNPYITKQNLAALYAQQAIAVLWRKDYRRSIDLANKAIALHPSRTAFNVKASAYCKLNELKDALESCNQAILLKSPQAKSEDLDVDESDGYETSWYAVSKRANIALLMGNAKQSLTDLSTLSRLRPLEKGDTLTEGLAKEYEKDFLGASEALKTVVEKSKQTGSEICRFAESELERLSNYRAAAEISQAHGSDFQSGEFWQIRRAVIQKQPETVYALTSKYLAKNPRAVDYMIDQANALEQMGNSKKAQEILASVNQLSPHNQEAQWALAESDYQLGQYPQAFALFDSLSKDAPRAQYFIRLSKIARKQGQYLAASSFAEKAIALDPDVNLAHSDYAAALIKLGRFAEAGRELHHRHYHLDQADDFAVALVRLIEVREALHDPAAKEFNVQLLKDMGIEPKGD